MNGEWIKFARQAFPDTRPEMLQAMSYDLTFVTREWPISKLQNVQMNKGTNFKQWKKDVAAFDLDKRRFLLAVRNVIAIER